MNTEERIIELIESLKYRVKWNEEGKIFLEGKLQELASDFLRFGLVEVLIESKIILLGKEPISVLQILPLAIPEMQGNSFAVMRGLEEIGRVDYFGELVKLGPTEGEVIIGSGMRFDQSQSDSVGSAKTHYSYTAELEQRYIETLEELGWSVSSYTDDGRVEINRYSPAGEDFSICVAVNDFPQAVAKCAEDFDVDEHVEMWIEGRKSGVSGIPSSIRELLEDAEAIERMIQELADALREAGEAA